jgi:hypothetical protein
VQPPARTPAVEETGAFDRPIAALAERVVPSSSRLDRLQPATQIERSLLAELRAAGRHHRDACCCSSCAYWWGRSC